MQSVHERVRGQSGNLHSYLQPLRTDHERPRDSNLINELTTTVASLRRTTVLIRKKP